MPEPGSQTPSALNGPQRRRGRHRRQRRGRAGPLWLALASSASSLGSSMTYVALPLVLLDGAASTVTVGVAVAALAGGQLLAGLPAGALIDRLGTRRTAIAAQLSSAALLALLSALPLGTLPLWALVPLAAALGASGAPRGTAVKALAPAVANASGTTLARANALLVGTRQAAMLLGPSLAALLTTTTGARSALLADAGLNITAAGLLWFGLRPTQSAQPATAQHPPTPTASDADGAGPGGTAGVTDTAKADADGAGPWGIAGVVGTAGADVGGAGPWGTAGVVGVAGTASVSPTSNPVAPPVAAFGAGGPRSPSLASELCAEALSVGPAPGPVAPPAAAFDAGGTQRPSPEVELRAETPAADPTPDPVAPPAAALRTGGAQRPDFAGELCAEASAVGPIPGSAAPPAAALGTGGPQRPGLAGELRVGVAGLLRDPVLRALTGLLAVLTALDSGLTGVVLVVYVREVLHAPALLGVLVTAFAGGSLLGTALSAVLAPRLPGRMLLAGSCLLLGVFLAVPGAWPRTWAAVAGLACAGVVSAPIDPVVLSQLQQRAPAALLGRVLSGAETVAGLSYLLGVGAATAVVGLFGAVAALLLAAAVAVVTGSVVAAGRGLRFLPVPPAVDPGHEQPVVN